ncbi:MAG TPA: hypothetical protein VFX86_03265 [Candidatus Saccharimonadales bacterium]|nr:hypothetical protein [Candidatus Saccharimonadales bacterium]
MLRKNFEDRPTKRKRPYNRAVEKRLYFQEHLIGNPDVSDSQV